MATKGHRLFTAFYERMSVRRDREQTGPRRARLVGDLRGTVLEVGAGNGLNLAYYRNVERVVALEPDRYMLEHLRRRARQVSYPVEIVDRRAEELPFPEASFDAVVASLVLCSVDDPTRVLAEVRRVLKPSGQLRFLEHVRGYGLGGAVHDVISPLWKVTAGGCRPNRQTEQTIRAAGFAVRSIERYREGMLPHVQGEAVPSEG
jgi:ubiquinone/menaquinone biosynthesis C-methylase UbiE